MDDFFCRAGKPLNHSNSRARKKRSLADTQCYWAQGQTLKIAFIDKNIDPTLKQAIIDNIMEYQPHINLKLVFVDHTEEPGHVRIGTAVDGKGDGWSAMGTLALEFGPDEATLNLAVPMDDASFPALVKHEFGHVLGLEHEQLHPDADIPWDKEKVYAYYLKEYGMSAEDVDDMVLAKLPHDEPGFVRTRYDKRSVMHYPVPNELTVGDWEVGWNSQLSEGDEEMVRRIYPKAPTSPTESAGD
jgi:hypothetical protein